MVDRVVVPTEFARRYYAEKLGLTCEVLPLVVDPGRVEVVRAMPARSLAVSRRERRRRSTRRSSTRAAQGCTCLRTDRRCAFAAAAGHSALDGGRGRQGKLSGAARARLRGLKNVRIMPNLPDSRKFLAATRILLMPSLMENAGLVAMEAMLNGIPVLASNRGGLPETIDDAGFLFDIPARYTPETRDIPTAEEVEPWVETIIRLWDDPGYYNVCSRRARERSQRWHPNRLGPIYREFFGRITRPVSVAAGASAQPAEPFKSAAASADDPCAAGANA